MPLRIIGPGVAPRWPRCGATRSWSGHALSPGHRMLQLTRRLAPGLALACVAVVGCREDAQSPTGPESGPVLATTATTALAFTQVSAGTNHTCGVTADYRAYCWGANTYGGIGDGTTTMRLAPVAVAGGRRFRQVLAGDGYTCAITPFDVAFCWGYNYWAQLGDGTFTDRLTPVRVAGGLQFRQVTAGDYHTCGLTTDNRAYCWGANFYGQLGDGHLTQRTSPVPVAGGHSFRQVSAGDAHTCGVTPTYEAYCWGYNGSGELGNGTNDNQRLTPALVAGGHLFAQVDAGYRLSCGVTTINRAFCWGEGRFGQIGDGKTYPRFTPRAVAGGLSFSRVSAGGLHTCGETTNNLAYCWGYNGFGELGNGTSTGPETCFGYPCSTRPVAVAGGLSFRQVSAGDFHTCGKTTAELSYCWGSNVSGQLGDGTTTDRLVPVAVAGPI
jgi:alpha-tubulin suppressor-like RCC1 family protein